MIYNSTGWPQDHYQLLKLLYHLPTYLPPFSSYSDTSNCGDRDRSTLNSEEQHECSCIFIHPLYNPTLIPPTITPITTPLIINPSPQTNWSTPALLTPNFIHPQFYPPPVLFTHISWYPLYPVSIPQQHVITHNLTITILSNAAYPQLFYDQRLNDRSFLMLVLGCSLWS